VFSHALTHDWTLKSRYMLLGYAEILRLDTIAPQQDVARDRWEDISLSVAAIAASAPPRRL
jgi:hypothetical protein